MHCQYNESVHRRNSNICSLFPRWQQVLMVNITISISYILFLRHLSIPEARACRSRQNHLNTTDDFTASFRHSSRFSDSQRVLASDMQTCQPSRFWWDSPALLPDVPRHAKSWKCPAFFCEVGFFLRARNF